mmetsp:Transcript_848/g.1973  ORF Transcript_848/g.1973 Transcript_848/m.1973 type:complete len:233 (+) Transcript_848:9731-10429(+)
MVAWFAKRKALVIGGTGALGKAIVGAFKKDWHVTSIAFVENPDAHSSIILQTKGSLLSNAEAVLSKTEGKYQAIMNVAGAWTQGSIADIEVFKQMAEMNKANLDSSLLAAHIATTRLADTGMLLFTGAALPYNAATPTSLAYGISKTCTHWLALNLSVREQIPSVAHVVTILPEGIRSPNTPVDSGVGVKNWVKPDKLAALIKKWADGKGRPENGSYVLLKDEDSEVVPEYV